MNEVPIIVIHGLWNRGPEAWVLRRRLRRYCQRPVLQFSYETVSRSFATNVDRLVEFLRGLEPGPVDLVAHSMGGLLLMSACNKLPAERFRRIVLLGSPLRGSLAAQRMAKLGVLGRWLAGGSLKTLVKGLPEPAAGGLEIGVIAGSKAVGMGRILGPMDGVSDGTVRLTETRMDDVTDELLLPVSHTGMLFSDAVARAAADFLDNGEFIHPDDAEGEPVPRRNQDQIRDQVQGPANRS
jgi:pimeloyl-ACP methyl ester carboxylesterase